LRRRLRALCREHAAQFEPGHAYLIAAGRSATTATYGELDGAMRALLVATASA
jgi:RNase P protein component